jgi:hypothetical protein
MIDKWLSRTKFKFEFLHKDDFNEKYNAADAKFPSAYLLDKSRIELFISQDEMNAVKSIDELKDLVNQKIEKFGL